MHVEIRADKAAWHYISHDQSRLGSGFGDLTDGGRQGNADGAQRKACSRTWRGAQHEALVILFDLRLGQRVEIGEDRGHEPGLPRSAMRSSSAFFSTRARKLHDT